MQLLLVKHLTTVLVVSLVFSITICDAALPEFAVAEGTTVQEPEQNLAQAFKDALTLARAAAVLFDPCEAVYTRYFLPIDSVFVKQVFETIANVPFDTQINADTVVEILSSAGVVADLQPKFDKLELALGNNPSLPEGKQVCGTQQPDGGTVFAFSYIDPGALGPVSLVSLCDNTFQFPSLDEILNPPASARDSSGNLLPGYTCDGLGDHDTDWMTSPGGILLHELMHWMFLLEDIPNYDDLVDENEDDFAQIGDFHGPNPSDGYGPYNTMLLRTLRPAETIQNADNFVWYAQSKYWSWICQKTFGAAVDPSDDEKRLGTRATQAPPESGGGE